MTDTESLLHVITMLVEELGTELELKDDEGLRLLAGTPTFEAVEWAADALRDHGRTVPPVVASLVRNIERASTMQ